MKRLDRFVLKSFIGPFAAILLIVVFILVMQFLWLYIDELVGKGLGLRVIAEFLMWGTCTILPLALPLATLLASMMTFGQMAENKELMAVKASGVSFVRIISPIIAVSAIVAFAAYYVGDNLVPKAYMEISNDGRVVASSGLRILDVERIPAEDTERYVAELLDGLMEDIAWK